MICSNCFDTEFKTVHSPYEVIINGEKTIIEDVEREECPHCGYSVFTHLQAVDLDKKRIIAEFGSKPLLTPFQLKMLRSILDLKLDEISEMLHIGKNTYGRWERGEVAITPSMNLLVHNFIDRMSIAKVNLIESFMNKEIVSAKNKILSSNADISLGKFLSDLYNLTGILPSIISQKVELDEEVLKKIVTNSINITEINADKIYTIASFLKLKFSELAKMLRKSFEVFSLQADVSFIHARTVDSKWSRTKEEEESISDILEALTMDEKDENVDSNNLDTSPIENYIEQVRKIYNLKGTLAED